LSNKNMRNNKILLLGGSVLVVVVVGWMFMRNTNPTTTSQNIVTEVQSNNTVEQTDIPAPPQVGSPVKAKVGGIDWQAAPTYKGALFYKRGVSLAGSAGRPYLQLSFKDSAGQRTLTVNVKDFEGKTGKVSGEMEVLLTSTNGSDGTQGYQDDVPEQKTDFTLTITNWEDVSESSGTVPGQSKMSATFAGTLKGILGSEDVRFEEGSITDLMIETYKEAY
jgi:hypothetical protein